MRDRDEKGFPYKNAQGLGLALRSLKDSLKDVISVETWTGTGNVRHWRFEPKFADDVEDREANPAYEEGTGEEEEEVPF